jgi:Carbohydrate-binding module 48 (Isoamylase N-terminal domain)
MGASLCPSGATFRAWAPRANAVYLNGTFASEYATAPIPTFCCRTPTDAEPGFLPGATDGDSYIFLVVGNGNTGTKRDPYAREMAIDKPFPACSCVVRSERFGACLSRPRHQPCHRLSPLDRRPGPGRHRRRLSQRQHLVELQYRLPEWRPMARGL